MKALMFSGGKDSMACLYLYKQELSDIEVIWVNTGRYYPEALETINKAKELCPRWHEVKSDRLGQWGRNGLPSDLVPMDWTLPGQNLSSRKNVMVQSYIQCCFENIAQPAWLKVHELGCDTVIRGQRSREPHRAVKGDVNGIKIIHPIENWTEKDVFEFLSKEMGELPEHYALEHSSMDCFDCTAFAEHSADRAAYTREKHPELYEQYIGGIRVLHQAMSVPMRAYERLLHA